jgi:hypothetical protein
MMSAFAALLIIVSLGIVSAPAALADQVTIPLGYSAYGLRSQVEAHLQYVEIGDDRKGSTQITTPLERVKWFRLFYQYENHGNTTEDGDLKLEFIDEKGNVYKLDDRTYTGDRVSPNSIGSLKFVELPISRDSNIVTIRVYKGFEYTDFPMPGQGAATPTATVVPSTQPVTATPTPPTATPKPTPYVIPQALALLVAGCVATWLILKRDQN